MAIGKTYSIVLELLILNRSRHWKDVRGRLILKNQKSLKWVSFHYLNCLILYECIKINIVKEMSKNQSVILFQVIVIRILISYLRKTFRLLVLVVKKRLTITWTTQKPLNYQKIHSWSILRLNSGTKNRHDFFISANFWVLKIETGSVTELQWILLHTDFYRMLELMLRNISYSNQRLWFMAIKIHHCFKIIWYLNQLRWYFCASRTEITRKTASETLSCPIVTKPYDRLLTICSEYIGFWQNTWLEY